jgi:hypothetical protein
MDMEAIFEQLCEILEDELERQENVLAQCRAQQEAARMRDVAGLEARSSALQILFREATAAEPKRQQTVRQVAAELGLHEANPSLGVLVEASPEPWDGRLRHLQGRLRDTLQQSRNQARENAILFRRSLRTVTGCLQVFRLEAPNGAGHYTQSGHESAGTQSPALLVNQRG